MNDERQNGRESGLLVTGIILIVLGSIFLLDRFTAIEFGSVIRTWWPMFVVGAGVARLIARDSVWNGLWLIGVGAWLQAVQLELFGLTYRNSWPLLLIVLGAGMVVRSLLAATGGGEKNHGI